MLDADLTSRMRALAGLRNRLVHVYDRIDDVRVHAALTEGLGDLEAFGRAVSRFVTG